MIRSAWIRKGWPPVAVILLLVFLWQLVIWIGDTPHYILPSPWAVASAFIEEAPIVAKHTIATLHITVIGFLIGSAFGLAVAYALHLCVGLRSALAPLLVLSQNVPIVVLAPLLVVWFGFGLLPKYILLTLVCFFPVAIATLDGLARADRNMIGYMRMAGATRWVTFIKLEWPWSLPAMFSGLKVSATYSVLGAVIAEWVGAERGLGVYLMLKRAGFQVDHMFVAIFVIVLLSQLMFFSVVAIERRSIRWARVEQ
jgi:ABC-type nitrate/sulfonate/bicarbonate transport system permease component